MTAILHDSSTIEFEVYGPVDAPALLLPVNPAPPVEGPEADQLRAWGGDPALGHSLIKGFSEHFRVVAFDYEAQLQTSPKPETLTPGNLAADFLAVADAAEVPTFAYYGYSWLGLAGLQLAIRTDRLTALVMGGFPPLDGPYAAMLQVTEATYELAGAPVSTTPVEPGDWDSTEVAMSKEQAQQFVTLYRALQSFDDHAVHVSCPRLCIAGSADNIQYGERWGNAYVSIGAAVEKNQSRLEELGWAVHLLPGLDHLQAMHADKILPIAEPWLREQLLA
ncbi:alpha/beta fold hydrolase [Kribbella qitaiheensis]|uniref:alpha/beta fold hydrolase n=1 Tax=Kribbella qitaiheensis TaxID=1544730 RepID=UPI001FE58A26|nr:alpha/beta hydrolase [Kribbella qitaiheensis]